MHKVQWPTIACQNLRLQMDGLDRKERNRILRKAEHAIKIRASGFSCVGFEECPMVVAMGVQSTVKSVAEQRVKEFPCSPKESPPLQPSRLLSSCSLSILFLPPHSFLDVNETRHRKGYAASCQFHPNQGASRKFTPEVRLNLCEAKTVELVPIRAPGPPKIL